MNVGVSFGLWLQKRRKALDLTREELAQRVGYSVSALRKIETDLRHPSIQLAELLANVLDIPADERSDFIRIARGELSIERLKSSPPLPDLSLLQPLQTISNPIPLPPTPLIGRERELVALRQMLADPQCGLITLIGPGGIGKTHLAIETATYQKKENGRDMVFVSLASVNSASLLPGAIADALELKFQGSGEPREQLIDHLRQKKLLLVLDNFEHLLNGVGLLVEIIQFAAQVKILCTSREQLNVQGEWVFEVRGLGRPEAKVLFENCARRVKTDFVAKGDNQITITQICRLVEGMPLAIELAAAWIGIISLSEIEQEIQRNLDFLSTRTRDLPERHRSMQAVFDHSWVLLTKEEQQVLSLLSVFRGGFTREAAEQVAGANLTLLSRLVAKSIVQRTEEKRFSLHELVRQFAAKQLKMINQTEKAQRQHITFFTDFAEMCKQHFGGPLMASCLERMTQDNDNLRAALDYSISLQASQMGLRLGAAMWRFWEYRGQMAEGLRWLKAVLVLPFTDTDEYVRQRAKVLSGAGALARIQGDFTQARSLHEESLAVQRKIGNVAGIATALNNLGVVKTFESQYALAEAYFQESLQIYRELGNDAEVVKRLNNLGVVAMYQGKYEKARLQYEESIRLYRELDDRHGIATSLGNLGDVLRYEGNYDRAMQVLEESLAILEGVRDEHGTVITLGSIARVQLAMGKVNEALATFYTSLKLNQKVGDKTELVSTLESIADALSAHARRSSTPEHEVRLAMRLLAAAGQLRTMVGAPRSTAEQVEFVRVTAQLEAQLTSNVFVVELERGAAMTAEQAVEVALHHLSQFSKATDLA